VSPAQVRVPFLDLAGPHSELRTELDAAFARVLDRGSYVLGPEVEAFETEFAAFTGARACVGVGSGLEALRLALAAAGVGPGQEVIVPAHTFIATWLAVSDLGAIPVPVDVDPETALLTAAAVGAAVTPRTRAIVPVHLYGQPVDCDALEAVAARHGLFLLFDAAQAHGARWRGRALGGRGGASAWSFYPGKNLGALGDGGAVTTDDLALAARLRRLRNYGQAEKYVHVERGVNSRLDELQAAFLRVKLPRVAGWNARRAELADRYRAALPVATPPLGRVEGAGSCWHLLVVRALDRDLLRARLADAGVQTLVHYPVPPHLQAAYAGRFAAGAFPAAEALAREVLSLPMGPHLCAHQVDLVAGAVHAAVRGEAA
jgi:dTDP-3-amino-3,4,6-trideoxy-alpha-D-glucose transaminase